MYHLYGLRRNSLSSQEVVDFVSCKLKEKVGNGEPTQKDLSRICESVSCLLLFVYLCGLVVYR